MAIHALVSALKFSEIRSEFGSPPNNNLGAYRVSQTVSALTNMPLDTGIPQSGTIRFSDFLRKKLNVVVDETPPPNTTATRVIAKNDYDANNNKVTVIGGFRSRPSSSAGIKVWIHINGPIGSNVAASSVGRNYCSFLTGTWIPTTDLIVDIGPSGNVMGAGGNGGNGRSYGADPTEGQKGTSALGVTLNYHPFVVTNRGTIIAGGGGGGGGGGALQTSGGRQSNGVGGGGGGGNGYPSGTGGQHGGSTGTNGGNGTLTTGGNGGTGGIDEQTSGGGAAGGGGGGGAFGGLKGSGVYNSGWEISGQDGTNSTNTTGGSGGAGTWKKFASTPDGGNLIVQGAAGGDNGHAIIVSGASNQVTITGGTTGDIVYDTAPE